MTPAVRNLAGRIAVVTGGARGIGAAVAAQLARHGAVVAVLDRDPSNEPDPSAAAVLACDITSADHVAASFAQVDGELGPVDILVNCAGINARFDAVAMTTEDWSTVMDTDLRGAWLCARQVLEPMVEVGGGSIVNVTSIHARMTIPGFFPYAAAKAGLEGLTRSLANDYGRHGVRVNAVAPGYTRTRLVAEWLASEADVTSEQIDAAHPLGRIVEPDEVAAAVCFLASDDASAITGATLAVDCGLSARFAT